MGRLPGKLPLSSKERIIKIGEPSRQLRLNKHKNIKIHTGRTYNLPFFLKSAKKQNIALELGAPIQNQIQFLFNIFCHIKVHKKC